MKKIYYSVTKIPQALVDAQRQTKKIKIPEEYKQIENIVTCGMGGSNLAGHIIKSIYFLKLNVPFEIVRNYRLPFFVNQKTLVTLLSYSGNTKETLSCLEEAKKRGGKIFAITSGGKLKTQCKASGIPLFVFQPRFNPSGQPRFGLPYLFFGLLALLEKINLIRPKIEFKQTLEVLKKFHKNSAEKTAKKLLGKIPIIIAAEHLGGNAHVFANQINETAKNFSAYFLLPEVNHHLLEGLTSPPQITKNLIFLFLNSNLYQEEIKKRARLTMEVVEKNKVECLEFNLQSGSRFTQVWQTFQFSSFVSYYLAKLNKVDPAQIPWVDYFKAKLQK